MSFTHTYMHIGRQMCVCVRERESYKHLLHVTRDKSRGKVASRAIYFEIDKPRARERKGVRETGHKEMGLREGAIKGRLNA